MNRTIFPIEEVNARLPFASPIADLGPTEFVTVYCQNLRCRKRFEWARTDASASPPLYHSKKCRPNQGQLKPRSCPRPDKQSHASHAVAQGIANEINARQGFISVAPYRCVCGSLHLGNRVDWGDAA